MTMHDQTMGRIVRRNTDSNLVSDDYADLEAFHLAAQAGKNFDAIFKLHFVVSTTSDV